MFERAGYAADHRTNGHIVLRHTAAPHRRLTIPDHRVLSAGILSDLITAAGLTVEEFRKLR